MSDGSAPLVEGETAGVIGREGVPQVTLRHVLSDQGDRVLEHTRPQELHDVAMVERLEDGHLVQESFAATSVAGFQHFDGHRSGTVQLSQVHLQRGSSG